MSGPTQEWADHFECPIHGRVSVEEITTKKTHLGCRDPETGSETMLRFLPTPPPQQPMSEESGE